MNGYLNKIAMLISVITNYLLVKFLSLIHFQDLYIKDKNYYPNDVISKNLLYDVTNMTFYTSQCLMFNFVVQDN